MGWVDFYASELKALHNFRLPQGHMQCEAKSIQFYSSISMWYLYTPLSYTGSHVRFHSPCKAERVGSGVDVGGLSRTIERWPMKFVIVAPPGMVVADITGMIGGYVVVSGGSIVGSNS